MKTISLQDFVLSLFSGFSEKNIKYCVLRNYSGLPQRNIGNDIDVLIREESIPTALSFLTSISGIRVTAVNRRAYVTTAFIAGVELSSEQDSLQIDFVSGLEWKGCRYLEVDEVLASSQVLHSDPLIVIPAPFHEAQISFFSSYLLGGWIKERYQSFVQEVFNQYENEVMMNLASWAGEDLARRLILFVQSDQRSELLGMLPTVRSRIATHCFVRQPASSLCRLFRHYWFEIIIRFSGTPIKQVCILGMDGAGKSTIINGLVSRWGYRTKDCEVIHLKPRRKSEGTDSYTICTDPHALPPRGKVISILKLLSWVFMYHLRRANHGHTNATMVIWDRYILDVLVDPRRYRVDLPRWLLAFIVRLAPAPDAVVVLDVPADVAFARKPEVPLGELYKIRQGYLELAEKQNNALVVSTEGSVEGAVQQVLEFVTATFARNTTNDVKKREQR